MLLLFVIVFIELTYADYKTDINVTEKLYLESVNKLVVIVRFPVLLCGK